MSKPALHIRKLSDFSPQKINANAHSPFGMGMLDKAMSEDGYVSPMTAVADGEVIDGSARLEVSAVKFEEAIVIEHDGTRPLIAVRTDVPSADDPRAKRISLRANRVGEVNLEYDPHVLALLKESDPAIVEDVFGNDLEEILARAEAEQPAGEMQDVPPQLDKAEKLREKYGVQEGQIWQLGRHKIACLNSLDKESVERLVDSEIHFVWSDPPYGISIVATNGYVGGGEAYDIPFGGVKKKGHVGGGEAIKASPGLYPIQVRNKGFGSTNGPKPFGKSDVRGSDGASNMIDVGKYAPVIGDDTTATAESASGLYLSLYPNALQMWWGANYYAHVLPPSSCWIVWDKENTGNFADAELAWCSDKSAVRIFRHMWNGLMKDSERGVRRVHPTQKPVALAAWAFEKYGTEQDVIIDPFLGSGMSLIAAEQMPGERTVVGFELAPEYIAVCLDRWATLTSKQPQLLT